MDLLSYILLLIFMAFFFVIAIRVVWFALPFLLIAVGVMYLRFKYLQNKQLKERKKYTRPKSSTDSKIKDDVIDVEYTVRDSDD